MDILICRNWKTNTQVFEIRDVKFFYVAGTSLAVVTSSTFSLCNFPSLKVKFEKPIEKYSIVSHVAIDQNTFTAFCTTIDADGEITIFPTNGPNKYISLANTTASALHIQRDYLARNSEKGVQIHNLLFNKHVASYPIETHAEYPCIRLHGNFYYATIGGVHKHNIVKFDLETGSIVGVLRGHTDVVRSFEIGKKHLYSFGQDGVLRVWDLETNQQVHFLSKKPHHSMSFSNTI